MPAIATKTAAHAARAFDSTSDPDWALKLAAIIAYEASVLSWADATSLIRFHLETVHAAGCVEGAKRAGAA